MLQHHLISAVKYLAGKYAIFLLMVCTLIAVDNLPLHAQIELKLYTAKHNYLLEEQVYVTVIATNTGPSNVKVYGNLQPESPFLDVLMARTGKSFATLDLGHADGDWERSAIALEPGESWSASIDLTMHANASAGRMESLLLQPGTYIFRIAYRPILTPDYDGPTTTSNDLELYVLQPEHTEAEAYSLLCKGKEEAKWNTIWNPAINRVDDYEAIISAYPQSEYTDDALFYLAASLHAQVSGKEGTEAALSNWRRAAECLESAASRAGYTPLGLRSLALAASYYGRVGDIRRAQELFQEVIFAPSSTDDDRLTAALWLQYLEEGSWQQYARADRVKVPVQIDAPLRSLACALGYTVNWDYKAKKIELRSTGVTCTLHLGESAVCINGEMKTKARVAVVDGITYVSPGVIAALAVAATYPHDYPPTKPPSNL